MNCPYSDEELAVWDGVTNPMGKSCYSCKDFDCEHNNNYDENPECVEFDAPDGWATAQDILGSNDPRIKKDIQKLCDSLEQIGVAKK